MSRRIQYTIQCNFLKALLLLLILWLSGCARLPVAEDLPPGVTLHRIGKMEADAPFAPSPTGDRVALTRDGLRIFDPITGKGSMISGATPVALAWTPDGERLAAAFAGKNDTRLQVFGAGGESRGEIVVEGRIAHLLWISGEQLLVGAVKMETFSFGSEHRTIIYRWNGSEEMAKVVEHYTVAKPRTLHDWGDYLYRTVHVALSPLGDEILYTRLHDPPAFSPYLKIVMRHLETGVERELANVSLTSVGGIFAHDETVIYGDGSGRTRQVDPWMEEERELWPTPGRRLSASEGGRYLFIDGRLYSDGSEILAFPPMSEGCFAFGGRLFIRDDRSLYLLEGLGEDSVPALDSAVRDHLLKLRRWRSGGLISHQDYLQQKQRIFEQ